MTHDQYIADIRRKIACDDMQGALQAAEALLSGSPQLNEVLLQSGRYHDLLRRERMGLLTTEDADVTRNRIRFGLLDMLTDIEEFAALQPALQAEIKEAIQVINSRNVVIGSTISAGGNVHIGDVHIHRGSEIGTDVPYNELCTRGLVAAIAPHHEKAARITATPNWDAQRSNFEKVQLFLATSFVGGIGTQISKLMAIGKEPNTPDKAHKYTEKCLFIAKRSLDLVNFALISRLWDTQRLAPRSLSPAQVSVLSERFDAEFEPSFEAQYKLLHELIMIDKESEGSLFPKLQATPDLQQTCHRLGQLAEKTDTQYNEDDAVRAIGLLCGLFGHLGFLVNYRMASVKRVSYHRQRNKHENYLHRYSALGIDNKANIDAEKLNMTEKTAETNAVILYHGDDYYGGINLSPFVIDYNTLSLEQGSKICFYTSRDITGTGFEFRFLEDGQSVRIEKKGMPNNANLNELLLDNKNRIALNMDHVADSLQEARRDILGDDLNFLL